MNGSKRNTMKNCNVSHSKQSGLDVGNGGLMMIDGNATTIHRNGTSGDGYGLCTWYSSSSIHLVSPLTKEMISTNNHRGQNYTGYSTIQTITTNNTKEEKNICKYRVHPVTRCTHTLPGHTDAVLCVSFRYVFKATQEQCSCNSR